MSAPPREHAGERDTRSEQRAVTPALRWSARLLAAGGLLSALNGAAHVVLPAIYPWEQLVEGLYAPLRWALFATTWFFALLLVLAGALTIAVARAAALPARVIHWVAGGMAAFWLVAAVYELAVPFPIEEARWALPAFSVVVAGLHLGGLWLRRRAPATAPRP